MKAVKVRIYPDEEQIKFLEAQFGAVRFVYNKALFIKKHLYQFHQINVQPIKDLKPLLAIAKKSRKYQWLKDFDSIALQQSIIHLDRAYKNFFNKKLKAKFPTWKKKVRYNRSYHCTGVSVADDYIKIPKLKPIKATIHRQIEGQLKSITIAKNSTGKYFASLLFDEKKPIFAPIARINKVIGIDFGLTHLLASCNGYQVNKLENPRFLKNTEKNLRRKQKQLSRKMKGSNKRKKARRILANVHEKLTNTRNDFQHKLTRAIVDENQAVIVETLSSINMLKNRRLSKAIADVAWHKFIIKLEYKLKEQGKYLRKVDRYFASSKICHHCGEINKLELSTRKWQCPKCKTIHDRDINAAINIRNEGISMLQAEGLFVSAHRGLCKTSQVEAVA